MTEQPTSSESRRFPRLNERCEIRYKQVESGGLAGEGVEAITVNISGGGICFICEEQLELDSVLAVELQIPDFVSPVVSMGRVAWCDPVDSGSFEIGIEFWWIGWGDEGAQQAIRKHIKRSLGDES